jgi:CheY-like chemotaxis protein
MSVTVDGVTPVILVIEDHETTARMLASILRSAGYNTVVAHSATEGLAKAVSAKPAVAVIDIHLPDLNGLILASQLRQLLGPDVPLLVCSGDTSLETLRSLTHVGATYFLSKPTNSSRLLEVIRTWIPTPPGPTLATAS